MGPVGDRLRVVRIGDRDLLAEDLDAERVPGYFERFSEEPVFVGNRFDLFRVSRDREHEWTVDFEIATRGPADE